MAKSRTLANLRARWPHTKWRMTAGPILPRLRWTDGPSGMEVNAFLCSDINTPCQFGRTLSESGLRAVAESVLHDLRVEATYTPMAEYPAASTADPTVPRWTVYGDECLCNAALCALCHWDSGWGLDRAVTATAFRFSLVKDGDK